MKPHRLLRWLHGFGQSNRACRRQRNGSHAPTLLRQPYLRRPRLEWLEERTLLSTVYVDDSATGLGNGTSWANAYTSLQAALSAAVAPEEIRVAQGTYKPTLGTDRTVSFVLRNGVSIIGGYAGYGAPDPDARDVTRYASILSGDIGTVGDTSDNSYHVVVGSGTDATAVLDGFTITAGNADGDVSHMNCGGGMYNSAGSPRRSPTARSPPTRHTSRRRDVQRFVIPDAHQLHVHRQLGLTARGGGMYNESIIPDADQLHVHRQLGLRLHEGWRLRRRDVQRLRHPRR